VEKVNTATNSIAGATYFEMGLDQLLGVRGLASSVGAPFQRTKGTRKNSLLSECLSSTCSFAVVFAITAWVPTMFAEEDKKPESQGASRSLQEQIEELKQGQERLAKEVEGIKQMLEQRSGRGDFAAKPSGPSVSSVNVHGEPFRGDLTARVAIMEFSDFDCSFCGKYAREVYPSIDQDYVKAGKVRYFFRDVPAPGETNAFVKARAARCAGEQGKFWEMHDVLFGSQGTAAGDLIAFGHAVGLDAAKFDECLSSEKYSENIQRSVAGARRMGIFGTPAFIVGEITADGDFIRVSKVLVGAQTYQDMKTVLDSLLANPGKP
jgi:protein-disulfide isomerase